MTRWSTGFCFPGDGSDEAGLPAESGTGPNVGCAPSSDRLSMLQNTTALHEASMGCGNLCVGLSSFLWTQHPDISRSGVGKEHRVSTAKKEQNDHEDAALLCPSPSRTEELESAGSEYVGTARATTSSQSWLVCNEYLARSSRHKSDATSLHVRAQSRVSKNPMEIHLLQGSVTSRKELLSGAGWRRTTASDGWPLARHIPDLQPNRRHVYCSKQCTTQGVFYRFWLKAVRR
jgi:hypothetical protein